MKSFTKLSEFFHDRKKPIGLRKIKNPLREFIYLDEISVYSLLASKSGAIPVEFHETKMKSKDKQFKGSLTSNMALLGGQLEATVTDINSNNTQIIRKSIIQTQFRQLYEETISSALFNKNSLGECPKVYNINDLKNYYKKNVDQNWIIASSDFARGRLLETEIQLEAEQIYQAYAVISSISDLLPLINNYSFPKGMNFSDIKQIFDKLLVGLIPITGIITDYRSAIIDGNLFAIHKKILDQIEHIETYSINIVGVTSISQYWKDIRFVLFDKAIFNCLCRISVSQLQENWNPVKMINQFEVIIPGFSSQFDFLNLLDAPTKTPEKFTDSVDDHFENALVCYSKLIFQYYKSQKTEDLESCHVIAQSMKIYNKNQKDARYAFKQIEDYIFDHNSFPRENTVLVKLRADALEKSGLSIDRKIISSIPSNNSGKLKSQPIFTKHYVEAEIIALYW
jgi:hypothetical protein